jgi:hypothetical protein
MADQHMIDVRDDRQAAAQERADPASLYRLTGERGLALWAYVTDDSPETVLSKGYFDPAAGRLNRHDRIVVTADAGSDRPRHGMLVVRDSHRDRGVSIGALSGAGLER